MSTEPIRENDYYGGDLAVEFKDDYEEPSVTIAWRAWGRYGGADIVLEPREALRLAEIIRAHYEKGL